MARIAAAAGWMLARALTRAALRCAAGVVTVLASLIAPSAGFCQAQPVVGTATLALSGGFARLVVKLSEDVESEVTVAGSILVIRFKQPVDVPVDGLSDAVPDYVGSARRDPDGLAIRLALSRKVTVNSMVAGERIFVDLLPDTWKGIAPGLPLEVIRELTERARAAERALRQQRAAAESKKRVPIRVRAAVQPTFVRFMFELPDGVGVSSALGEKNLLLNFNAGLTFDLADAKLTAPPNVSTINQNADRDKTTIEIGLIGEVDVRSFREEKNFIVDIGVQQTDKPAPLAKLPATLKPPTARPMAAPSSEAEGSQIVTADALDSRGKPQDTAEAVVKAEPVKPSSIKVETKPEAAKSEPAKVEPARSELKLETPKSEPSKTDLVTAEGAAKSTPEPMIAAPLLPPSAIAAPAVVMAETGGVPVDVKRNNDGLRLNFAFGSPTPMALFRRGDMMWLVLDSTNPIDVASIRRDGGSIIGDATRIPLEKGQAIRLRLNRPQLASLTTDDQTGSGQSWSIMLADVRQTPSQALTAFRNIADPAHANVVVPLVGPGIKHRLVDPDAGDALTVITALPPPRGFIRRQDFVEFSFLESIHGMVIQTNSDDVVIDAGTDKVTLSRPGGLTLSAVTAAPQRASSVAQPIFDIEQWRKDQEGPFVARLNAVMNAAVAADAKSRTSARIDLARFYMARGMYHEGKAAADWALADVKPGQESQVALIVHAVTSALIGRTAQTFKDIASPVLGSGYDAEVWKGLAYAADGKWVLAREKLKNAELAIASLPVDLQRIIVVYGLRAALEVKDYAGAAARASELQLLGIPPELTPTSLLLGGWLDEALGHDKDAFVKYHEAIVSSDRQAAAEAKLRDIALRQKRREISPEDATRELETLSAIWRGDAVEAQTLQRLSRLYAGMNRYQDSLLAARTATELQSNSDGSRQVQDEASELFSQLFLSSKGDNLPPVDALGMFYEYRELTPIGRRGDEMIRRLADRLVAVDLLDQASDLLQYQVDHRLEGAARAQVASRLAMVYLMNRKPERAIAALNSTRIADLAGELRQQRLLLEARAQSDIGRRDLALDIISNIPGKEAIRLRSDIYWSARRWREASEQIELYYADRWRDFTPLTSQEKSDIIRAVVGYALAEDALGLARFREKYSPLMTGADKIAFDTASKPASVNSSEFAAIAKMAASLDTLDGFLREMKVRFPDRNAKVMLPAGADPASTGSLPNIAIR